MATYKGTKGIKVQSLASDLTASDSVGQLWYNTTSAALKYSMEGAGSWAAGGTLNNCNRQQAGAGTQTAGLSIGGYDVPGGLGMSFNKTEEYDGTSWTEVNALGYPRYGNIGCGPQTAALTTAGWDQSPTNPSGSYLDNTELYNGTTWTETADLLAARSDTEGCGTQTAALCYGGTPPSTRRANEEFNGTSWSEEADLVADAVGSTGIGTATAALCAGGGGPPGGTTRSEEWNGTAWAEGNNLNAARRFPGFSGTQTASMFVSGWTSPESGSPLVEQYDGTCWSEVADVTNGRAFCSGSTAAANTATMIWGGDPPSAGCTTGTEEWSEPVYSVKTVTTS